MKFRTALLTIAFCLLPLSAWAADADTDVGKVVTLHPMIAIIGTLLPILVRVMREDVNTPAWATWAAPYRLLLIAFFGAVSAVIDQLAHGFNVSAAVTAVAVTAAPALFVEILHLVFGPKAGGGGSVTTVVKTTTKTIPPLAAPPYSTKLLAGVLACGMLVGGCGANLPSILNEVATDMSDAAQVLDVVRSVVNIFFLSHPNPDTQTKVEQAMAKASLALNAALRATKGVQSLSEKDKDAAFADFRSAYDDLTKLLTEMGISDKAGKLASPKGGAPIVLPMPLALTKRS